MIRADRFRERRQAIARRPAPVLQPSSPSLSTTPHPAIRQPLQQMRARTAESPAAIRALARDGIISNHASAFGPAIGGRDAP
jgi:hypothetical protein